ncbi:hypothetical protein HK099_006891 [Clydaea vesicula]|uniref:Uncharacterized protein n=1 Tax=Clydaea vesicula TaxID=447962 RepID=A0AAD5U0R2_9FUNG|nr:hypothetical protein HK099_006891 [Clydaea vesicula]
MEAELGIKPYHHLNLKRKLQVNIHFNNYLKVEQLSMLKQLVESLKALYITMTLNTVSKTLNNEDLQDESEALNDSTAKFHFAFTEYHRYLDSLQCEEEKSPVIELSSKMNTILLQDDAKKCYQNKKQKLVKKNIILEDEKEDVEDFKRISLVLTQSNSKEINVKKNGKPLTNTTHLRKFYDDEIGSRDIKKLNKNKNLISENFSVANKNLETKVKDIRNLKSMKPSEMLPALSDKSRKTLELEQKNLPSIPDVTKEFECDKCYISKSVALYSLKDNVHKKEKLQIEKNSNLNSDFNISEFEGYKGIEKTSNFIYSKTKYKENCEKNCFRSNYFKQIEKTLGAKQYNGSISKCNSCTPKTSIDSEYYNLKTSENPHYPAGSLRRRLFNFDKVKYANSKYRPQHLPNRFKNISPVAFQLLSNSVSVTKKPNFRDPLSNEIGNNYCDIKEINQNLYEPNNQNIKLDRKDETSNVTLPPLRN